MKFNTPAGLDPSNWSGSPSSNQNSGTNTQSNSSIPRYSLTPTSILDVSSLDKLIENEEINRDGNDSLDIDELQDAQEELMEYFTQKAPMSITANDVELYKQLNSVNFLLSNTNNQQNLSILAGGDDELEINDNFIDAVKARFGNNITNVDMASIGNVEANFTQDVVDQFIDGRESFSKGQLKNLANADIDLNPFEEGYEEAMQQKLLAQKLLDNFDDIANTHEFGDGAVISAEELQDVVYLNDDGKLSDTDINLLKKDVKERKTSKEGIKQAYNAAGLEGLTGSEQKAELESYIANLESEIAGDPGNKEKSALLRNARALLSNLELINTVDNDGVSTDDVDRLTTNTGEVNTAAVKNDAKTRFEGIYNKAKELFPDQTEFTLEDLKAINFTKEERSWFLAKKKTVDDGAANNQLAEFIAYLEASGQETISADFFS